MARSACLFQVSLSCFLSWALRDETRFSLELNAEEVEGPCASFVMSKLKEIAGVEDPGARIGAVLADQAFLEGCCDRTEYDDFIAAEAAPVDGLPLFTEHTALVIVDMQRDFTEGSFAQPCWAKTGARFLSKMLETIEEAKAAGSLIIATKDFHPFNHCSFAGESSCMNKKDLKEESALSRYVNEFPSHCSFSMKGRYAMPQKASDTPFCQGMEELGVKMPFCRDDFVGADLEPRILQALAKCEAKQVEVVYKGFNPTYDSFSAMHHAASSDEHERNNTGAFALEENRSRACHGKWEVNATCYPTVEQLKTTDGLRNFSSILMTRGIKKIVTVGLVYDYCVKETAIFTRENMPEMEVIVLSHLTRPSFDGKPGAPYTAALCDGRDLGNGFCSEGGGTKAAHQKVLADYKSNDVAFVREKQNQYVEDDSKQSQEDE
ncbi:unnamed protein product [Durusdinium trenchii]|uniref:Uncharacterized protein n=2 Tax=Durusdinium trenchii TaxID=1381693 RepID=A0ABP0RU82_9DINO